MALYRIPPPTYSAPPAFGDKYRNYNYLKLAGNIPKEIIQAAKASNSKGGKLKREDIAKKADKYQQWLRTRKSRKGPSVKKVREELRKMVYFSILQKKKEFQSAFPLLTADGRDPEESDSDDESSNSGFGETHGSKINAQQIGKALHKLNSNIPNRLK